MKKIKEIKELLRFYTNVQRYASTIISKKWRIFVFVLALLVFYTVWEYQVVRFSPKQNCILDIGGLCVAHSPDVSRETVCALSCGMSAPTDVEVMCGPANVFYWFLVGVATGMVLLIIMVEGETMIDLWRLMQFFEMKKKMKGKKTTTKKEKTTKRTKRRRRG